MHLLEKIMSSFKEQQVVYLATAEEDQPRVRPMSLIHLDKKFYMITGARGGKNAKKLQQLRVNPRYEYYLPLKGEKVDGFIRGYGDASIIKNKDAKKRVYNAVSWAREYFNTVEHPDYVLIELEHEGFSYRSPNDMEIHYLKL